MTPEQVTLVKTSFRRVMPISPAVAATFYNNLFIAMPETRRLFSTDMEEQGRKLMLTLATVVHELHNLQALLPSVQALGRRHVGYGVVPKHYDAVGAALLAALNEALGAHFDADTRAAWTAAYTVLAQAMIAAAEDAKAAA